MSGHCRQKCLNRCNGQSRLTGGKERETSNLNYFGLEELTKECIRHSEALKPVRSVSEGDKGLLNHVATTKMKDRPAKKKQFFSPQLTSLSEKII